MKKPIADFLHRKNLPWDGYYARLKEFLQDNSIILVSAMLRMSNGNTSKFPTRLRTLLCGVFPGGKSGRAKRRKACSPPNGNFSIVSILTSEALLICIVMNCFAGTLPYQCVSNRISPLRIHPAFRMPSLIPREMQAGSTKYINRISTMSRTLSV